LLVAQDADEELGVADLARRRIDDVDGLPRIVDEDLFAGLVLLAQYGIEVRGPRAIEDAEAGVLIAVGVRPLVFLPQELERHTLLLQLAVDGRPVRERPRHRLRRGAGEEPGFERRSIDIGWQGPRQPGRVEAAEVIAHRAVGRPDARGDLADAPVTLSREAEDFNDLAHG
jgi:hypothetical protein